VETLAAAAAVGELVTAVALTGFSTLAAAVTTGDTVTASAAPKSST
jgi:hypothetical protein